MTWTKTSKREICPDCKDTGWGKCSWCEGSKKSDGEPCQSCEPTPGTGKEKCYCEKGKALGKTASGETATREEMSANRIKMRDAHAELKRLNEEIELAAAKGDDKKVSDLVSEKREVKEWMDRLRRSASTEELPEFHVPSPVFTDDQLNEAADWLEKMWLPGTFLWFVLDNNEAGHYWIAKREMDDAEFRKLTGETPEDGPTGHSKKVMFVNNLRGAAQQ